jgi:hypothetical protein
MQYGVHDDNAIDRPQKIDDIERIMLSPLKRLNSLLGMIASHKPEAVTQYIKNLEAKLRGLVSKDFVELKKIELDRKLKGLEHLKNHRNLAMLSLNYVLERLDLPVDIDWSKENVEVKQGVFLHALLSSRYYNILVLTETINRNDAIEIYKKHFELINREWVAENEERFQNLEEFFEDTAKKDPDNPGWVGLVSEVRDGKVLIRKDSCLWAEAMSDYPDSELKFLVCCYGDYTSIKVSNRHFELTMEHSIAGGHNYCDCVVYDTRITTDLKHPSDEFFANLKPSK